MPQQDILGHPKTKVFISHCGNLGTQEAKYHGVPVLALPIAFDQPRNAARMQRKGYALVLQWEDLTVEDFVDTLNILINDTQYQDRMDAVSRIVQDQKESPVDTAVWWLEYVVRHKGAPHLQYAGRRLSLFQYVMLDVILFWSAVLLVIVLAVVYGVRAVCCRGTKGEERQKQTMKKKQ
ncbi:UNVERIFIED_CONTAM: hypothetical protein GTU68_011597 [Idotea baltica]|nr:hypothetical protein [Idotea baltica]